jgi:hypothetical protein
VLTLIILCAKLQIYRTGGNFVVADQKIAGRNQAHCIYIQNKAESKQEAVLADDFLLSIQRFTN